MIPGDLAPLANHLWQSTVCVAAACLLTLALRKNRAALRYGIWLSASLKFLVPFSVLVEVGRRLPSAPSEAATSPAASIVLDQLSRPFATASQSAAATAPRADPLPILLLALWACGVGVVMFNWWRRWRHLDRAARMAKPMPFGAHGMPVLACGSLAEPGVFGIRRPVLLLPEGIEERLTRPELAAILTHEHCHARRRDNLGAALHMMVEALFWFYPLVWWMERQLVTERERACDEEVLRSGCDPETYAEGILKVCRFYVESLLVCAAGVTGADLKRRIEDIMARRVVLGISFGKKLLLYGAACAVVAVPLVLGILDAPAARAQARPAEHLAFEAASVKPSHSSSFHNRGQFLPGGRFVARNVPLFYLVAIAYDLPGILQGSQLSGGPGWTHSQGYDIEATAGPTTIPPGTSVAARDERIRLMLQTLLSDRFHLVIHRETKELPVYAVRVGKGGPKMPKAAVEEKDCSENPKSPDDPAWCHGFQGGMGRGLHGQAVSIADLVLGVQGWTDRPVVDQTGLRGLFNIQTEGWVPMLPRPPRPPGQPASAEDLAFADPARPTLFQIFDRLGLKLEPAKAPVDVYVIDSAEMPTPN